MGIEYRRASAKTIEMPRTSAHLLSDHDRERSQGGTSDARDGEQLNKPSQVVAPPDNVGLFFEDGVNVEEVTGWKKNMMNETG